MAGNSCPFEMNALKEEASSCMYNIFMQFVIVQK